MAYVTGTAESDALCKAALIAAEGEFNNAIMPLIGGKLYYLALNPEGKLIKLDMKAVDYGGETGLRYEAEPSTTVD